MAESLLMIALSPTMTEGSIARWKLKENDAFVSGDPLCEVETDKASMDYEAPKSGVLLKILVPEGGKATVGQPIAFIGKAGERVDDPTAEAGGKRRFPYPRRPNRKDPHPNRPNLPEHRKRGLSRPNRTPSPGNRRKAPALIMKRFHRLPSRRRDIPALLPWREKSPSNWESISGLSGAAVLKAG